MNTSSSAPTAAPPSVTTPAQELIDVQIDGKWVKVPKGINAIEAAKLVGKFIPHYCYHPELQVVGNCRMCLIELGTPKLGPDKKPELGADGRPLINWMPRPQIACATTLSSGMAIRTESKLVTECRNGVLEFLLLNHPLDCPICDQAGECKLQEYSLDFGNGKSRFIEQKNKKPKAQDIGKHIILDDERCILCSRCIRFMKDIAGDDCLGFIQRGSRTYLTIYPGKRLDNPYSLNTVDICPVGALTSKDFRFKMRVWFLKETKSIDPLNGLGANILISSREGIVYRITPRENPYVNKCWLLDESRFTFHALQSPERFKAPLALVGRQHYPAPWDDIVLQICELLRSTAAERIAIVASARMTTEELYLTHLLREAVGGNSIICDVVPRPQKPDHLLIPNDGNPNSWGAKITGISQAGEKLPFIAEGIRNGRYDLVLALHEDLTQLQLTQEEIQNIPHLVALALTPNTTTANAHYILAGAGFTEKRGTFINIHGRIQRLNRAVPPPGNARDDWEILNELLSSLGKGGFISFEDVFQSMCTDLPPLNGLTWAKIGDLGYQLALDNSLTPPAADNAACHTLAPPA